MDVQTLQDFLSSTQCSSKLEGLVRLSQKLPESQMYYLQGSSTASHYTQKKALLFWEGQYWQMDGQCDFNGVIKEMHEAFEHSLRHTMQPRTSLALDEEMYHLVRAMKDKMNSLKPQNPLLSISLTPMSDHDLDLIHHQSLKMQMEEELSRQISASTCSQPSSKLSLQAWLAVFKQFEERCFLDTSLPSANEEPSSKPKSRI